MFRSAPRIVAVVLARNRPEILERTVEAIERQDPRPALVLVGNNPTPGVRAVFERLAVGPSEVHVVDLRENAGAAGGFHAGIARALELDPDFVCCFDDDATPLDGCLAALVAAADRVPDVGCVGALTHAGDGTLSWPLWTEDGRTALHTVADVRGALGPAGTLRAAGLCWHGLLVPADVLRRHGNIWAELFHQYEDAEFGLRLRAAGLHVYLAAEAECLHPVAPAARELTILGYGLRITGQTPAMEYLTLRNDLVVRRRYNGARFWYGTLPLILLRGLLITLGLPMSRARALRHVYLRAITDAFRGRLGPPPATLDG